MKRIWQNHFKAAKRPAQGTLDIKCKLFSLTQPVRASLWTERSVNCESLPNLSCFVKEKCRKKEDRREANFFFFYLLWISPLFSSQVLSFSILYWFPFCVFASVRPATVSFFFHMILQQKKYTRGKNTSNFNRLKDEDTFHIWCCFPHSWWMDRGQAVLPNESFLLPSIPSELESRNESAISSVGSGCQKQSVPNFRTFKP